MPFGGVPLEEPGGRGPLFTTSLQSLVGGSSWRVFILRHVYLACTQGEQQRANRNTLGPLEFCAANSTKVRLQRYELGASTVSATPPVSIDSCSPHFQTQILDSGWSPLLDLPGLLQPSKAISNIPFNPTPNQKPRPTRHQF